MGTGDLYRSMSDTLKTLHAWRRQRFAHALFLPVATTLVLASLVGGAWPSALALAARGAAAWLAVLALRLWDDLEDRRRDARDHPERVLTRVGSARPYLRVVAVLLPIAGLLIVLGGGTGWGWLALVGALWIFYRLEGPTRAGGDFVVLLKYPLLVLALGGAGQPVSLAALALILAAVCMDEVLQRTQPHRGSVVAGTAALVGSASLMLTQSCDAPIAARALQTAMIAGMAALSLQSMFGKPRRKLTRGGLLAITLGTLLLSSSPKFAELIHAH